MRPDEHKKKKNAQYKKKHGITSSRDGKTAQKPEKDRDVTKTKSKGEEVRSSTKDAPEPQSLSEKVNYSSDVRKLPSNWDRYEIKDKEVEEKRGEDFSLLLQSTSFAVSQFRFKAEQDWMDEPSNDPISIDFNRLGDSLSCIPLHKRLGVEAQWFEDYQIKEFEEDAEANRLRYLPTTEHQTKHEEQVTENYDAASSMVNSLLSDFDSDQTQMADSSMRSNQHLNMNAHSQREQALVAESVCDTQETDELLDELLSLSVDQSNISPDSVSTKTVKSVEKLKPVTSSLSHHTSEDSQESPDGLCVEKSTAKSISSSTSQTKAPRKQNTVNEQDSLDDWLDSVLDD